MQEASDFVLFLGRFHPLVVHLPIGFLLFAFLLELAGRFGKNEQLTAAVPLALLSGAISALVASVLGYMLSLSGDYDSKMLDSHFWFGVFTTLIAFFAWLIRAGKINIKALQKAKPNMALLTLITILLGITGHYGGNLTHGSDYLTKYAPFNKKEKKILPPINSIEEAEVYAYLVDPIIQQKCVSCHNPSKRKGGLAMHDSISLVEGGKNGPILAFGESNNSEFIHRVTLEESHEDFMPPEGKTPLTEDEIALLRFWIDSTQTQFSQKLGALKVPEEIMVIASRQLGLPYNGEVLTGALPTVSPVDENILSELIAEGFQVRELVNDSYIFDVALPSHTVSDDQGELTAKLQKLAQIKDNVLRLDLSHNQVGDEHLALLGEFGHLQQLQLEENPFGDAGIAHLSNLERLESINLYGTQISKASLDVFSEMKGLKKVYLWKTRVKPNDLDVFESQENFPDVILGM